MNLDLSPEEEAFRDEVRTWLDANIPKEPRPHDPWQGVAFDKAWQRRQYDGGWAGIAWPTEYGGRGLSIVQQLIWYEEYAKAGAPWIGSFFVALNHGGPTLILRGNEEQKAFYLPKVLTGETNWCQGFSEPGSGSDLASLRTTGVIEGDELVVNGQKTWTTFGHAADFQELLLRTDPDLPRHKGLSWVVCDMKSPGITVHPIRDIGGHLHFAEVFYDNVRIPLTNVVGGLNAGWSVALSTLSFERGTALTGYQIELARDVERMVELAGALKGMDGRPWAKDEEMASRLAGLRAEVAALRAMTYAVISRGMKGETPGPESSIIALYFGELGKKAHRLSMDLLGPKALMRPGTEHDWPGEYLAAFRHTIAGGTAEIRRNIIGERVLGLPR